MAEKGRLDVSGETVKGDDASHIFPTLENTDPSGGSTAPATAARKKRGRPRKYSAHGSVGALSPTPISVSIPLTGDYSCWNRSSAKKKQILDFENSGAANSGGGGGGSFIPHVVTVNPGEDVMQRIMSFSQQGTRAICILAANGAVSNVTLSQANSSGATLTYEGQFDILSLTGSLLPSETGVAKTTSGGITVSLAGHDGRVLGGGLAGMLVASSHVQVVIGSFVPVHKQQQSKKPKYERTISFVANTVTTDALPVSEERHAITTNTKKHNLKGATFILSSHTGSMNSPKAADHENDPASEASEDSDSRRLTR